MTKYFLKHRRSSIARARKLRREMTDAERKLWSLLRKKQLRVHFRKQVPFGPYILDFLSITGRVAIEVDGSQHFEEAHLERDAERDAYLRSQGLTVLRFSSVDVLKNTEGVWQRIEDEIQKNRP